MTAPHEVVAQPRNRLPLLVGGGVALLLSVFLATKVLGGGGGDRVEAVSRPSAAVSAATTATTVAPAAPEGPAPVETFEVFTTKNPFMPLRTSAAATPAAATPAPAAPAAVAIPVAVTPAAPVPAPAAPPAAARTATTPAPAPATTPTTVARATEPVRSMRVALLDVFAEGDRIVANVRVNDTVSKVGAGDTFASNFKVVSLDSAERCGRFLFGDDQFRLCKGEEILK